MADDANAARRRYKTASAENAAAKQARKYPPAEDEVVELEVELEPDEADVDLGDEDEADPEADPE